MRKPRAASSRKRYDGLTALDHAPLPATGSAQLEHEGRNPNGIKAISELTIQPNRRDAFVRLFESLAAQHFESMRAASVSD